MPSQNAQNAKNSQNPPITLTFTIDPTLRVNPRGQRYMDASVLARRGEVGQISQIQISNWKTELPAEIDRLVRLLLNGGLVIPDFPDLSQAPTVGQAQPPDSAPASDVLIALDAEAAEAETEDSLNAETDDASSDGAADEDAASSYDDGDGDDGGDGGDGYIADANAIAEGDEYDIDFYPAEDLPSGDPADSPAQRPLW
jgi:hypothetical protein